MMQRILNGSRVFKQPHAIKEDRNKDITNKEF